MDSSAVDSTEYEKKPRHYALGLVKDNVVSADEMLNMCINFLSYDDVKMMLDNNELSPRFLNDEEDNSEDTTEDEDTES